MSVVVSQLKEIVSGILGGAVAEDQPLMEAGLDSLAAVELRNTVGAKFGVELPATVIFDYPSIRALAQHLTEQGSVQNDSDEEDSMDMDMIPDDLDFQV